MPAEDEVGGAWTIARVAGIPLQIHWTLLLILPLFAYLMAVGYFGEEGAVTGMALVWGTALAITLFASVLLHEFSHSFMAMHYGTKVRSILLMPLGGVSRMEAMPEQPRQEFMTTVVGPVTNFVLAAPVLAAYYLGLVPDRPPGFATFVFWIGWLNVGLGAFNLFLPAFPMDGGRLLRAALTSRIGLRRATAVAARVGRGAALLMGLVGILAITAGGIWLVLIAFFVYMGSRAEEQSTTVRLALADMTAQEVMTEPVETLDVEAPLAEAWALMMQTRHVDFPVVADGRLVGSLDLERLAARAGEDPSSVSVRSAMTGEIAIVRPPTPAADLLQQMETGRRHVIVTDDGTRSGRILGIVSATDLERAVLILDAHRRLDRP